MKYCKHCKVNILDESDVCPLCQHVLEKAQGEEGAPAMYPMISLHRKWYQLMLRIFALLCLIAMVILSLVNYVTYTGVMWSLICDAAILYMLVTFRFTLFNRREGHTMKILVQVIAIMLLTLLIDYILGYSGWSLAYAIPTIVLVADVLILILMLVNLKIWHSYILLQIAMLVLSVTAGIFMLILHMKNAMLMGIAIGVTAVLFLGTICIGDTRAKNEIKRRFHV